MTNALKTFRLDTTRPVVEIKIIKCHNAEFLMDTHYHHFENDRFVFEQQKVNENLIRSTNANSLSCSTNS